MRVMMRVTIPTQTGNKTIENEVLPKTFSDFIESHRPEAAYFVAEDGCRTGILVFDLASPADIPAMCEPFFMNLDASIAVTPAMNAADMRAGVAGAMKKKKK